MRVDHTAAMKYLISNLSDPIPLVLSGGGHYGLTDIKDVRVSREFVGLGQAVTQCQTKEAGADCLARRHQETVLTTCGCAPFSLSSHYGNQVGPTQNTAE